MATLDVPDSNTEMQNGGTTEVQNEEEEEEDEEEEEEARAARIAVSEQTFQFMDFVRRFVHYRVIQSCGLMLRQFEQNALHTNHCALKLLHRIAFDCKVPAILFQATLFRTFQRILDSSDPQHKELQRFAIFIIRKFTEVAQVNPKVYMELLFWKTSKDAYDIENGYGSYHSQSSAAKKIWSEEEEDELRRLYEEFMSKTEGVGQDVVDWIMENMINKDRSRRGVVRKLKELGYAIGPKNPRKSTDVRLAKEWAPEEIEQLTALYQQFKDAYDPLGCIMERLTVRRPKSRVIEKLLSLGLVSDRKELHKKRGARKSRTHESNRTDSDDSLEDSDVDSDASISPPRKATAPAQQTKAKRAPQSTRKPKKSNKSAKSFSVAEVTCLLKEIIAAGMTEALEWIGESLEETAEDQEHNPDDIDEGVPLLPLSEAAILAMDTPSFQNMLQSLGINSPADEQEVYWRIPASLSPADLRHRKAVIDEILAGGETNIDDSEQATEEVPGEDIPDSHQTQESGSFNEVTTKSSVESPGKAFKSGSSVVSNSDHNLQNGENITSATVISRKKRTVMIMDSSDSEDDEAVKMNGSIELSEEVYIERTAVDLESERMDCASIEGVSTETSSPHIYKRRLVDSDSENETVNSVSDMLPKKRLIKSDSEDESVNVRKTRKVLAIDDDDDNDY
ncbi:protein timeless homolog [Anabrus simplex]|uniref:protein timeless homolog n=1 Tax=Anabrus simplex TaxID=316456 RepID=UPI0035A2D879